VTADFAVPKNGRSERMHPTPVNHSATTGLGHGPSLEHLQAYLDEFAFRHNRRMTNGVGRIAARVIERLGARGPLTMPTLIDDAKRCRWFRSAQPARATEIGMQSSRSVPPRTARGGE
jgi:hypothetical protein